jgi:PST family polysaccharide transporter
VPTVEFGTLKVPLSLHRSGDDGWTRLVRSFATLAVGEGAARFFGLIAALVLARRLGPSGLGLAALGISLVGWFRFVVDSGTEALKTRLISETPERFRELADRVLGLRLMSALVASVLYIIVVVALSRSSFDRMVLLSFVLVLPAMALNLRWMVLGIRAQRAVAIANALARLVFVIGIVLLVYPHGGVRRVPYLEALSELTYGLVIIYLISHAVGIVRPRVDVAAWARTLRQSLPLMVVGLTQATLLFADILLIGGLKGPRFAGYYGAAVRPALFVSSVLSLFAV